MLQNLIQDFWPRSRTNRSQSDSVEPGSFMDWVRNPDWRRHAGDELDRWNEFLDNFDPDTASDNTLNGWVEKLLNNDSTHQAGVILEKFGERAVPSLVSALDDSRLTKSSPKEHLLCFSAPITIVSGLLMPHSIQELHARAAQLANSKDWCVSQAGLGLLASTGLGRYAEFLLRSEAESGGNQRLQSGLEHAHRNGKLQPELRCKFIEFYRRKLEGSGGSSLLKNQIQLLIEIADAETLHWLGGGERIRAANPNLEAILDSMNRKGLNLAAPVLAALVKELLHGLRSGEPRFPDGPNLSKSRRKKKARSRKK